MDCILKVIYNIPICGGFCAPTVNDEPCYRHVSNEYTVPLSLRFMQLSPCIESNLCCTTCGRVGLSWGDRHRKPLLLFAFALNITATIFTILAAVGTTENADHLRALPWVVGEGFLTGCPENGCPHKMYIGTEVRVDEVDCSGARDPVLCARLTEQCGFEPQAGKQNHFERTMAWTDEAVCAIGNRSDVIEGCKACREARLPKRSLILSIVTQFPTTTTDLQRLTRFGDVNCQKTMGVATNLLSFITSIMALLAFRNACWDKLLGTTDLSTVSWRLAPGFRLLMGATIVKVFDLMIHCLIPTPQARWKKPEGPRPKLAEYMQLGVAPDGPAATTPGIELGTVEPTKVGEPSAYSV